MELKRPLVVTHIDTTGKNVKNDRIIALSMVKVHTDNQISRINFMVNPIVKISEHSKIYHGIEDEEVKGLQTFAMVAGDIYAFLTEDGVCDYAGYSLGFQLRILQREFERCSIDFIFGDSMLIDAYRMWSIIEPRSLSRAIEVFCDRKLNEKRTSEEAVDGIYDLVTAQCEDEAFSSMNISEIYKKLFPENVDSEGKFYNNNGIRFGFGSYRGQLASSQPEYLRWMLKRDRFSRIVKETCRKILGGIERA